MQPDVDSRVPLVLGGTGAIGGAVLRGLARRGLTATFTYWQSQDAARAIEREHGHRGVRVDLSDADATRAFLATLESPASRRGSDVDAGGGARPPDVIIHCAARSESVAVQDISPEAWRRAIAVNAESAFLAAQWLAATRAARPVDSAGHAGTASGAGADIVLVGALDRTQSLPLPVHYAASQGMLSAMTMALAHELGPRGVRVNLVALGVMTEGLSAGLAARSRRDYERFSALRRPGAPDEAARAILWLALENRYIHGKVMPVNGGI